MSAPIVWILFPGTLAILLYFLRRWQRVTILLGILISIGLAWLAWKLPIGVVVSLRPLPIPISFELNDTLVVLGRQFVIDNSTRPVLVFIYLGTAFWFGGAFAARTSRLFIPFGLGIAALFTAAQAVEPFLYAALIIELAAIACIPILSPPGRKAGRGLLRYLSFQTLGMPFILFTGWMLTGAEMAQLDTTVMARVVVLMALGFAFFMGVFPFHTWIPMLSEEAPPFAAAYVFFIFPNVVAFFGLGLLERYSWMQAMPALVVGLRFVGALMVFMGGVWAAFQRQLGRMLGYTVIVEIGLSLLSLSASLTPGSLQPGGFRLEIFFALLLPRGIALALWALALSAIKAETNDVSFHAVQGLARRLPLAAGGLVLAQFSMAGLPLLGGFPARMILWSILAQQSLPTALLALIGSAGLFGGGIRTLVVVVMGRSEESWRISEHWGEGLLITIAGLILFLMGLMPQWFIPALAKMAGTFGQVGP